MSSQHVNRPTSVVVPLPMGQSPCGTNVAGFQISSSCQALAATGHAQASTLNLVYSDASWQAPAKHSLKR